ncbi:NADPH-dependent oxidoreductase [bacterium]|nr:NADPH-dependent oxidoreductase [bacterium]
MIQVISGTNRAGSNTLKVAKIIADMYRARGAEVGLLDLQDLPADLFSPASYGAKPAAFAPFQDAVLGADGLHVVFPEYNGSFPGVLKYFIDMLKFPESFEHRCVAYTGVSAGLWGNIRGVEQLQLVFNYRNAYNLPERTWLNQIQGKLNPEGTAITDAFQAGLLAAQVDAFISFVGRNKGIAPSAIKK